MPAEPRKPIMRRIVKKTDLVKTPKAKNKAVLYDKMFKLRSALATPKERERLLNALMNGRIKESGYTAKQIYNLGVVLNLRTTGFTIPELVKAGYSPKELLSLEETSGNFTRQEIEKAGFSLDPRKQGKTVPELLLNYRPKELVDAGYPKREIDAAVKAIFEKLKQSKK